MTQHGGVAASRRSDPQKVEEMEKAAESLRKVAALTSGLAEDSPTDAQLRDRLELAADVLDAVTGTDE